MFNNTASFTQEFSIEIESLYIAHVFPNINKKRIAQLFEKLSLARISGIDFISKIGKDGPYNSAYIHINEWYDNTSAKNFQEKIRSDAKEALLIYDEPWYWIVNENVSNQKSKFIERADDNDAIKMKIYQDQDQDIEMGIYQIQDHDQSQIQYQDLKMEIIQEEDEDNLFPSFQRLMEGDNLKEW